ncbi:hypothetical protein CHS0354_004373, partial [Potamilus streckersoni]
MKADIGLPRDAGDNFKIKHTIVFASEVQFYLEPTPWRKGIEAQMVQCGSWRKRFKIAF